MEQRSVNPWKWQDALGFSQAIEVHAGERVLYCAGQFSVDADGKPVHAGDMAAQIRQSLDNLEVVLKEAGYDWSNVVRLNCYTTEVDLLLNNFGEIISRLAEAGCQPSSTLLGVARLAFPELMIEIEATAVR
jgi:enamine deaminase RidA (YjgF/YER057c/UK114 family)